MQTTISPIKESSKVAPFFAFFIVHSMQVGVGVLGFQKYIIEGMGYDAWIAVILAGMVIHLYIWLIYGIMNRAKVSIIHINQILFGRWIGNFFNLVFISYLLLISLTVLRTYIEIVQVWMFPQLNTWLIASVFLVLVYHVIHGGFKSIVGICFLGVVIPLTLSVTIYFPFQFAHFGNLLPVGGFTVPELFTSMRSISLSYLGFEMILFFYPFINNGHASQKWAHLGNFLTLFLYLFLSILSFAYFAEPYLRKTEWATLTMWKVVEFSFLARFEYIGVTMWMLVILPILCMWFWASSRSMKQVFTKFKQRHILIAFIIIICFFTGFFDTREKISLLNTYTSRIGLYFLGVYIPILFILTLFRKEWRKK